VKKLTLDLDDLQVDSFATIQSPIAHEGTVEGFVTQYSQCMSNSCQACGTYTACPTGYTNCEAECSKDVPTQVWEVTCLPTCAGYTCDYETCGACYSEVC
jgi:hypothetical protein